MRKCVRAAFAFAALATSGAGALGLNLARTPDDAYKAAIIGALRIAGFWPQLP